ncbi:MAG: hypothetical protein KC636_29465, partial [Myxococcales bacterium]|nr:hypothetical protein [Myxococcales bacterium]
MTDSLEQLQLALRSAASEQFAGVMAEGLGLRLREPTDRLLAEGVGDTERELRHFRNGLDRFEERGSHDRSRVVAHGLRLCLILSARRADAEARPSARAKQDLGRRLGRASAPIEPGQPQEPVIEAAVEPESKPKPKPKSKSKSKSKAAGEVEARDPRLAALEAAAAQRLASVATLPGVGAKTRDKLAARGLETIEDLAYLLP